MKTFDISHFLFITCHEEQEESFTTNSNISSNRTCLFFLRREKFLPRSEGELTEQPLYSTVLHVHTSNEEN